MARATLMTLLSALLLSAGCDGEKRELHISVRGPAYPRPRCGKGPASLGRVDLRGAPVKGARLRVLRPRRGAWQKGNDEGLVTLRALKAGQKLAVQIMAPGYRVEPAKALTYRGGVQHASVTMQPCLSLGRPQRAVGFDRLMTLRPKNLCGRAWRREAVLSYRWRVVEGRRFQLRDLGPRSGPTLRFRTPRLEELRSIPASPQLLSFSPDQAGELVFELVAKNRRGETSRSHVLISATSVASGMTSVPPFATYVFAGEAKGPWKWRLGRLPKGWRVGLRGATTRTPQITPRPPGPILRPQVVELRDQVSGLRFSIVLGSWNTVRRDCGRSECHRSLQGAWENTPHGRSWRRLLDGELTLSRGPASEGCAGCHATGYRPYVDDGGYDDEAKRHAVHMPRQRRRGLYEALPQAVKDVSNVYCLACHGPGRLDPPVAEQPGLFGVGVCARCHDRQPEHPLVAQWRESKHAKTARVPIDGPADRPRCARCHSAQGFVYGNFAISRPHASKTLVLNCCETTQPITCQTCHDPMRATPKKQVRRFGPIATPSGAKLEMAGSGAICSMCHHADVDVADAEQLAARRAPHAPQTDLMVGRGGYRLEVPAARPGTWPRLEGKACVDKTRDSCVTCHMHDGPKAGAAGHNRLGAHSFALRLKSPGGKDSDKGEAVQRGLEHVDACKSCHPTQRSFDDKTKGDYDGDGVVEGAQTEVRGLLGLLAKRLRASIAAANYRGCDGKRGPGVWVARGAREKLVVVDAEGKDLGDCDGNGAIERLERPFTLPPAATRLHQAAYNYLVVSRDGSFGLHNYGYTVKLLQRTIAALGGELPKAWLLRR